MHIPAHYTVSSAVLTYGASCEGVKLVLPALLAGVDSKAWRSKQGSVQMLGAMAYLAPQPLSTALPKVVPKLSQTLSDPHPKVQAAARQALREVTSSLVCFLVLQHLAESKLPCWT